MDMDLSARQAALEQRLRQLEQAANEAQQAIQQARMEAMKISGALELIAELQQETAAAVVTDGARGSSKKAHAGSAP